jgi:hypothetical protein
MLNLLCIVHDVFVTEPALGNIHKWPQYIKHFDFSSYNSKQCTGFDFSFVLLRSVIRVPAKGNTYNWHYDVRKFWFG